MVTFNPHRQSTVGLEYWPAVAGTTNLGISPGTTIVLPSQIGETVDQLRLYLSSGRRRPGPATAVVTDLYDATDLVNDAPWTRSEILTAYTLPTFDGSTSDIGPNPNPTQPNGRKFFKAPGYPNGQTQQLNEAVDEPPLFIEYADWVDYVWPGAAAHQLRFLAGSVWRSTINDAQIPLANFRVTGVRIRAWVANLSEGYAATIAGHLAIYQFQGAGALAEFAGETFAVAPGSGVHELEWTWNVNPNALIPWYSNAAALAGVPNNGPQHFVQGANPQGEFGFRCHTGPTDKPLRIYNVTLEALYTTEQRTATSSATVGELARGAWVTLPLVSPVTGLALNWSKLSAHTYWFVAYRPSGLVPVSLATFDGVAFPNDQISSLDVPLKSNGSGLTEGTQIEWPPPPLTRVHAYTLRTTVAGNPLSRDSFPYAGLREAAVSTGKPAEQELSDLQVGQAYGIVGAVIRSPLGAEPDAPLEFRVRLRSNNNVVAGPVTLNVTDIPNDGDWREIRLRFATSFTAAAVQYYVQASSACTEERCWEVRYLDTFDATAATVNYGPFNQSGTVDVATVETIESVGQDLLTTLQTVPAILTGLAVSATTISFSDTHACGVASLTAAHVVWNVSGIAANTFAYYELQRSDDAAGFQTIARLATQASAFFYDVEGRRNKVCSYRVRVVRLDGAWSDWQAVPVTFTPTGPIAALYFTSNQDPDLAVGYQDETPHEYEFPDSEDVVLHRLFGRDYQSAFRPLEYRGDQFTRTLIVSFNDSSATVGRAAFAPMVTLLRTPLPYVAVLDGDGNRWLASVTLQGANREEPGRRYHAEVQVTEIAAIPAPALAQWTP